MAGEADIIHLARTIHLLSDPGGAMSTQTLEVIRPAVLVDYDHCSYCGACVAVCPPDCITLHDATIVIDHDACTRCQRCIPVCPTGALTIEAIA
jgi:NAD-dependent dihydropyrimidine dehydrogenase PreA subunit